MHVKKLGNKHEKKSSFALFFFKQYFYFDANNIKFKYLNIPHGCVHEIRPNF